MPVAIKICGLTTVRDIEVCAELGVEAIGIVLARSSRQVEPKQALRLFEAVPEGLFRVAVFREPDQILVDAVCRFPIDAVQTHATWQGRLPPDVRWLPAFRDGPDLVERVRSVVPHFHAGTLDASWPAVFFVDGPKPGSGRQGEIERAAEAARLGPAALAGGLHAGNVVNAIGAVQPVAVDVSSGVEAAPGVKDPARMADFVAAARSFKDST